MAQIESNSDKQTLLTEQAKKEVREYMTRLVLSWVAVLGIVNIAALWGIYSSAVSAASGKATTAAVSLVERNMEVRDEQMARLHGGLVDRVANLLTEVGVADARLSEVVEGIGEIDSKTVREFAEVYAQNKSEFADLGNLSKLNERIELLEAVRILAVLKVQAGKLILNTGSVSYDQGTGVVTFPNPNKRAFIPLVSDFNSGTYLTMTHFTQPHQSTNQFKVWSANLDTGDGNAKPYSFTAIVIGF